MIRTILGDIQEESLGACDFHEHFYRTYGPELKISSDFNLNNRDVETEIESCIKQYGQCSFVCMDPIGCGRDLLKMVDLANKFNIKAQFIMCTGFHKGSLYDPFYHWSQKLSLDKVVELISLEITDGIDFNNYMCPIIDRSTFRAGIIKSGLSYNTITPFELNSLIIASQVHINTGAPISIHTEYGSMCLEAIDILKGEHVDLTKVVFCHMHRNLDPVYFKKILDYGANLCFDGLERPAALNENLLRMSISNLVKEGYIDHLLLSMDAGRSIYHSKKITETLYTKGIKSVFDFFDRETNEYNYILIKNPRRILNFVK